MFRRRLKTSKDSPSAVAASLVGGYAFFGAFWIIVSDVLARALFKNSRWYQMFTHYDDWLCLTATAAFLFYLARRLLCRMRRLEEARQSSDTKFRILVEESLVGIYMIQDGRFTYANPRMGEIFGYPDGGIAGREVAELVAPPDRELVMENIHKRMIGESRSLHYEFRGLRRDGALVDVEVIGARADIGGKPAVLGTLIDLTGHKTLQKQFLQAQKMESIGRLAGGVAHDFNNILTAILGYAHLLLASVETSDPRRADVEEIKKAGERAAGLTRRLLAFSRQQVLQLKEFDLNALVLDVQKMLKRLIGEDIELSFRPGLDLSRIKADPGQIEQVLMNLVVNARDAMPKGGKISIATSNVALDADFVRGHPGARMGPHVMLSVSDTGCGMDAATQAHLFEPFFTTKEKGKGTGLGLATVYGIVKQSGGCIFASSVLGEGTSFEIYLPPIV